MNCSLCNRHPHNKPWTFKYGLECPGVYATPEGGKAFADELAWREEVNGRFGNDVASDPELAAKLMTRREKALERQANPTKRDVPVNAVVSTTQVAHVDAVTAAATGQDEIAMGLTPLEIDLSAMIQAQRELELSENHLTVPGEVPEPKTPLRPNHTKQGTKHQSSDYLLFTNGSEPDA